MKSIQVIEEEIYLKKNKHCLTIKSPATSSEMPICSQLFCPKAEAAILPTTNQEPSVYYYFVLFSYSNLLPFIFFFLQREMVQAFLMTKNLSSILRGNLTFRKKKIKHLN